MANDCVFKVKAYIRGTNRAEVRIQGPFLISWMEMTKEEWDAFRSGLMPNSQVDFIIEEEEDGTGKENLRSNG